MEIRRLGPIGAEVVGAYVKTVNESCFRQIYQAWLDYNVIVVRDQELSIDDYLAYSRRFGTVCSHPSRITRHPECPEVTLLGVKKFREDGTLNMDVYRRGAEGFHTDGSYEEVPFKATQLYAIAIPSRGGDTYFASAYTAYEALSERLKDRLQGKSATYVYGGRAQANRLLDEADRNAKPVHHPLIQTHPETGRRLLYFDQNKILRIEGMPEPEGDMIIEELKAYMAQPRDQYQHRWRRGDVVIWDNRCSYHKAAGDYPPDEDRIHWRVSIKEHGFVH